MDGGIAGIPTDAANVTNDVKMNANDLSRLPAGEPQADRVAGRLQPVLWVIAIALIANIVLPLLRTGPAAGLESLALAQTTQAAGTRGLFAFSGQMSKSSYGIYMVDTDAMTVWAYEFNQQKNCLRLAAARTWRYDRYLENYNICDLPPEAVEQMVDEQRQTRLQSHESQNP